MSPEDGVFGGSRTTVHLITKAQVQSWPEMAKEEVAERLMTAAALFLREETAAARRRGAIVTVGSIHHSSAWRGSAGACISKRTSGGARPSAAAIEEGVTLSCPVRARSSQPASRLSFPQAMRGRCARAPASRFAMA